MGYHLTLLEQQIKNLYHSLGIYRPDQIDLEDIASKLSIWVHVAPFHSKAQKFRGHYSIVLDSRLSEYERWEDFGHELCHVLMHVGNQLKMPKPFKEFQEAKANNFAQHFCVPTFMLLDSGIPCTWNEAVLFIMETYNVSEHFARKRLEHFNNQVIGFEFHKAFRESIVDNQLPATT
jgi:Zn-dependent peptidase ImmA (M78 family)